MLVFVDCESDGPCPALGQLTEFAAVVDIPGHIMFHAQKINADVEKLAFQAFDKWLDDLQKKHNEPLIFVSDNPAYDWQWINDGLWRHCARNLFGHSARRIGDFYAGLTGNFLKSQGWKKWRVTPHTHNALQDAQGNLEAFRKLMELAKLHQLRGEYYEKETQDEGSASSAPS